MYEWNTMWDSLQTSLGDHIPQVLGALAIFVIGWFVQGQLLARVLKAPPVAPAPGCMRVSGAAWRWAGWPVRSEASG